jgi:hypothetical protein
VVYLSTNPVQHQRTKHVEIDLHFFRESVTAGDVRVLSVPTTLQFTDIFTKGLLPSVFTDFDPVSTSVQDRVETARGGRVPVRVLGLALVIKVSPLCNGPDPSNLVY